MEKHVRSIIKSISFRIIATSTTILLVFLFTGSLFISASVGSIEFISKILIYYLHERMWNRLDFGREKLTANLSTQIISPRNSFLILNKDEQEK